MIIQNHYNLLCNECFKTPLKFDVEHLELYCSVCGLIHEKNIKPMTSGIKFYRIPFKDKPIFFI